MKTFIIFFNLLFVSILMQAQNNRHYPNDIILRGGLNKIMLDYGTKRIDAIDFQFTYNVFQGSPSLFINSKISYNPDYIEFNAVSLLGTACMAMAMGQQRREVKRIMEESGVSEERAWEIYQVPEEMQYLVILSGLLAIESASLEIPLTGWLAIEPSWSLLRFKKYNPLYSSFNVTGSGGMNLNIYLSSKFLLNAYGEYNWTYSKNDPELYKGYTYGIRLGIAF